MHTYTLLWAGLVGAFQVKTLHKIVTFPPAHVHVFPQATVHKHTVCPFYIAHAQVAHGGYTHPLNQALRIDCEREQLIQIALSASPRNSTGLAQYTEGGVYREVNSLASNVPSSAYSMDVDGLRL